MMDPETEAVLQALVDAIRALVSETRELGNRIELLSTEVRSSAPDRKAPA